MLGSIVAVWVLTERGWRPSASIWWLVPVLIAAGLAVAGYLAYVEGSGSDAVCGPVGDCNAVQQSDWARILGVPIGIIGIIGYGLMAISWVIGRFTSGTPADIARVELLALTAGGTLFSIYLTFLEPFVIGATCAWCLSSAVIVTALMWLSFGSGMESLTRLRASRSG
jgi:uncharacterized membrane protein